MVYIMNVPVLCLDKYADEIHALEMPTIEESIEQLLPIEVVDLIHYVVFDNTVFKLTDSGVKIYAYLDKR